MEATNKKTIASDPDREFLLVKTSEFKVILQQLPHPTSVDSLIVMQAEENRGTSDSPKFKEEYQQINDNESGGFIDDDEESEDVTEVFFEKDDELPQVFHNHRITRPKADDLKEAIALDEHEDEADDTELQQVLELSIQDHHQYLSRKTARRSNEKLALNTREEIDSDLKEDLELTDSGVSLNESTSSLTSLMEMKNDAEEINPFDDLFESSGAYGDEDSQQYDIPAEMEQEEATKTKRKEEKGKERILELDLREEESDSEAFIFDTKEALETSYPSELDLSLSYDDDETLAMIMQRQEEEAAEHQNNSEYEVELKRQFFEEMGMAGDAAGRREDEVERELGQQAIELSRKARMQMQTSSLTDDALNDCQVYL